MSKKLWKYASDGDLASIDRITSSPEGREKINSEIEKFVSSSMHPHLMDSS
jgi:hypothetical protein